MRKQTKKNKDKDVNGHKMKERLKSTQEEPLFDQDMEDEIQRIKHLPQEEFSKMFEKMLVRNTKILYKLTAFTKFRTIFAIALTHRKFQAFGRCVMCMRRIVFEISGVIFV